MQHHLKRERQFASQSAPELRRAEITRIVLTDGAVRVEELAERLNVSQVTVYRDIQYLEDAGLVERSKGELRPCATSTIELPPQI